MFVCMKWHFFGALVLVLFLIPSASHASGQALMRMEKASYQVDQGETFTMRVDIDPQGEQIDTVRAVVVFDPTVLRVQNVNLVGSFDRSAPGNYIDNAGGKISWGAFTLAGAVTQPTSILEVTFTAVQEGEGAVRLSADSRAIADGEEKLNRTQLIGTTITVSPLGEVVMGLDVLSLSSPSHPSESQWSTQKQVGFDWEIISGTTPIKTFFYSFSPQADKEPSTSIDGSITSLLVEADEDGVYYFRVKGLQTDGKETAVVTQKVFIDATSPHSIELTAQENKVLEGESVWLTFATTDDTSGVLQYQISMNNSEFQIQNSPLKIDDLVPGTYFFRVAALDRAGNSSYGGTSVRVYPVDTQLDRPEGTVEHQEVKAIEKALGTPREQEARQTNNRSILISVGLGMLALFGILYVVRTRKSSH